VQVSPERAHAAASFLFGDQPHAGPPRLHRAVDGEHGRGVVGGGGGRRRGVREGVHVGLLLAQLLLRLVQEHGVLDLDGDGGKEDKGIGDEGIKGGER